jgi:hypothetical protein
MLAGSGEYARRDPAADHRYAVVRPRVGGHFRQCLGKRPRGDHKRVRCKCHSGIRCSMGGASRSLRPAGARVARCDRATDRRSRSCQGIPCARSARVRTEITLLPNRGTSDGRFPRDARHRCIRGYRLESRHRWAQPRRSRARGPVRLQGGMDADRRRGKRDGRPAGRANGASSILGKDSA